MSMAVHRRALYLRFTGDSQPQYRYPRSATVHGHYGGPPFAGHRTQHATLLAHKHGSRTHVTCDTGTRLVHGYSLLHVRRGPGLTGTPLAKGQKKERAKPHG